MHMADALLSPAVGGSLWAASAAAVGIASTRLRRSSDEGMVPLMGVLGAFLFAAQMINFSIPATGSSGHLVGGVLLAILLGPAAAFITVASVLVVQALFFADGGLLALGCNIFNMALVPTLLVSPLVFKTLVVRNQATWRLNAAIMIASVASLQVGAFAVVVETQASGITSLPFTSFLWLMQPIHLAIGLVEGAATAAVIYSVGKARPEMLRLVHNGGGLGAAGRGVALAFLVSALLTGGLLSRYASGKPDGLEWAIAKVTGKAELPAPDRGAHRTLGALQEKSALFSGYLWPGLSAGGTEGKGAPEQKGERGKGGTGLAGTIGALITLLIAYGTAAILKKGKRTA